MSTNGIPFPATALLLVLISILEVSTADVIYLEGEKDSVAEFLKVKKQNFRLIDYFQRVKRDLFDIFDFEEDETATKPDENHNDEEVDVGLSSTDNRDIVERIIRVTFTVVEPHLKSCSDRESAEFYTFSKTLANAVNELYETSVPGSQKTRLVTIHSSPHDAFSCKVTLDIVTTGYDDTDYIVNILRNYIMTYNRLGAIVVNEDGFTAVLLDPVCQPEQFRCESDGRCIEERRRCDGRTHCTDGSDEVGCENNNVTGQLRPNLSCDVGKQSARADGQTHRETSTSKAELELVKKRLDLIEAYINETIHEDINEENKSDDYYYFMSLLPHMEKFTPLQRFRLRNRINQAIVDELNLSTHSHANYPHFVTDIVQPKPKTIPYNSYK